MAKQMKDLVKEYLDNNKSDKEIIELLQTKQIESGYRESSSEDWQKFINNIKKQNETIV